MALSKKHVKDICLLNWGSRQCKYLDEDFDSNGQIVNICKKQSPDKKLIDLEIADYLFKCVKNGKDPNADMLPMGDNCNGYFPFKSKIQGYDVVK